MPAQTLAQMLASIADGGKNTAAEMRSIITDLHEFAVVDLNATAVDVASTTNVTVVSHTIPDVAVGDIILVYVFGFERNATGANRTVSMTLDFDDAFQMTWDFQTQSQVQGFELIGSLAVFATNDALLFKRGHSSQQLTVGTMITEQGQSMIRSGYDRTTQDLTGSTVCTLKQKSDVATATQEITIAGFIVRKFNGS